MTFPESEWCTSRRNCYHCRNDAEFRKVHEYSFGPWECPIGLQLGAALETLPKVAQDVYHEYTAYVRLQDKLRLDALYALEDLIMVANEHTMVQLTKLRMYMFPETKGVGTCAHGEKEIVGQTEEECCGGKKELVLQYRCKLRGATTDRICRLCTEFSGK